MFGFSRKEPIEPIEQTIAEHLAKIHELHPDRRYVFWFEILIPREHIEIIVKNLERLGIKISVISGLKAPKIYEFEEENNGNENSPANPR